MIYVELQNNFLKYFSFHLHILSGFLVFVQTLKNSIKIIYLDLETSMKTFF